ncbi:MAG: RNA-guided endonuclease InsQ/TnpB family protein, partial [Bacilli bacterium]
MCFLSKNLYNVTLYHIRQYYKETGKYLPYNKLTKTLSDTNNLDYRAMPYAQSAQQVLRQVDNQYKAFYASIKSKKMKGKKVRLPKYKDKENGRNIFIYTNQGAKVSNGIVYLKTKQGILSFNTVADSIQQVRIVPKANHIVVEIIYNKECKFKQDNSRYASIDLGLNNLCTLTSNNAQSIIVDGKRLKSINHYYNKIKAKLQSKLQQGKHSSKRISRLTLIRNRKVKDYMHKVSRKIVEYMEANSLNT